MSLSNSVDRTQSKYLIFGYEKLKSLYDKFIP